MLEGAARGYRPDPPMSSYVRGGASRGAPDRADSNAVTGDGDDDDGELDFSEGSPTCPPKLRAVPRTSTGSGQAAGALPVQLRREYKGLTVADLQRDEIVDRLPGQVRSALHHLQRGDYAAAERALPGEFRPLLRGPGGQKARTPLVLWLCVTAVLAATAVASRWF